MKKILLFTSIIIIGLITFLNIHHKEKENVIKYCSWGSQSEVKILKEIINDFEKETNLKVEFIHIPQNYFQKLHLLFASNADLDVVFLNNQYAKTYINANLLMDLTQYINKTDFYDVATKAFEDNEKIYAFPRDISNLVLFVNKDILKKQNVKYKEKINSLNELKEYANKLTFDDTFGINSEENSLFWLYYLAANGGGVLSDDEQKVIINKKESIEAINFYANLINKDNVAPTKAQIGSMTTAQMFINSKLSMYLGGRWLIPKFRETINFDWDIIEFPSTEKNRVYIDASGWSISKNSKNKENAIKLVQFLSSKNAIDKFVESGLITPARKSSAKAYFEFDKNKNPKHSHIFIDMLNCAKPTPINKNYNKINDILNEEIQKVLSGEQTAEQTFNNKIVKKIESLI